MTCLIELMAACRGWQWPVARGATSDGSMGESATAWIRHSHLAAQHSTNGTYRPMDGLGLPHCPVNIDATQANGW